MASFLLSHPSQTKPIFAFRAGQGTPVHRGKAVHWGPLPGEPQQGLSLGLGVQGGVPVCLSRSIARGLIQAPHANPEPSKYYKSYRTLG